MYNAQAWWRYSHIWCCYLSKEETNSFVISRCISLKWYNITKAIKYISNWTKWSHSSERIMLKWCLIFCYLCKMHVINDMLVDIWLMKYMHDDIYMVCVRCGWVLVGVKSSFGCVTCIYEWIIYNTLCL